MAPLYLIDAYIYIFRPYFALPERWHSGEGYPTQAVYGYLGFLLNLLEQQQPDYIAAAFDESLGSCFRNDIYPDYKANRVLPDEGLAFQLKACAEVTHLLGIAGLASDSHEADDIIGTLACKGRADGHPVMVVSRDKDLAQLLRDGDSIWDFGQGEPRDRAEIKRQLGVWPEQLADYLALVGDPVDNIPGVPGVGPKTAAAMLSHFGTLDAVLAAGERLLELPVRGAASLEAKIMEHRDRIKIARRLTAIAEDAPVQAGSLRRQAPALDELREFCRRMGFGEGYFKRAARLAEQQALISEEQV
ncbi:MAG: 5'-3' exonuclease H3TH domain-containing protein [Porticoccaceae bacterium]